MLALSRNMGHLSSIDEDYYVCVEHYARVKQEHNHLSLIDEDFYARVEQELSHLSSINENYYAHVEQEHNTIINR